MALSFHQTTAPVFGGLPAPDAADMTTFHPEVSEALLGFVYDPLDPFSDAAIDELLGIPNAAAAGFTGPVGGDPAAAFLGPINEDSPRVEQSGDKKRRAAYTDEDARYGGGLASIGTRQQWYGGAGGNQLVPALPEFRLPLPLPLPLPPPPQQPQLQPQPQPLAFVRGADEKKPAGGGNVQSTAARERRKRISQKTAELSRLIPGGHRLSTADMLQEAARHVKLLQAQVGMLALMHSVEDKGKMTITAQEEMHALLTNGRVQEHLAAEGMCLVPRKLVDAVARDKAVKSNPLVNRDLSRFVVSLQ